MLVRSLWNRGVGSGLHDLLGSGSLARSTGLGSVWVVLLELLWVLLGILESIGLETSITSVRLWIAVDKLLLGELDELSCLEEMLSLHGGGGGESPA